jgi:hypothetical protein
MPAGFFVDGKLTYRPLVSVITEFAGRSGLGPANKVLAVVGEFPFLEKDVPYLFTSQTSFLGTLPANKDMRELANIIYNPSSSAPFAGSPAGVILLNAQPNSQALAYIGSTDAVTQAVKLKSSVWGEEGNSSVFKVVKDANGVPTVTITNRGYSENFNAPSGLRVLKLAYAHPDEDDGIQYGFGNEGGGTGTLTLKKLTGEEEASISFTRRVTEAVDRTSDTGDYSWIPNAPIAGSVTVKPVAGGTLDNNSDNLVAKAFGLDANGATLVATATFSVAEVEAVSPVAKTFQKVGGGGGDATFSAIHGVRIYPTASSGSVAAGDWTGSLEFAGTVLTALGPASGQETVAQAIQYLKSIKGFDASTESFKAATTPFASLDATTSIGLAVGSALSTTTAVLNSTRWSLVSAIAANSKLVTVEDLFPEGAALDIVSPYAITFAGGSKTSTISTDWLSAFTALMTSPITVLFPYTTNHDIHMAALDHVRLMWGKGQRECQLVIAPPDYQTLTQLNTKRQDLQDFRVTMLPQSTRVAQWDGSTSVYSTLNTGLVFASMQCANPEIGLPMGGARPRVLSFDADASIKGTDAADTLLANSMTPLEDLGDGIRVARWVTTYSEDNDLVRTEGSSVEAIGFSNIGVRNAVKPFLNTKATPAVAPAIRSAIAAELSDQVYRGILRAWQPDSLIVEEVSNAYIARYSISPVLPVNHIAVTSVAIAFPIA